MEGLKLVISADVSDAIKGVERVASVIQADFTKATKAAEVSTFDLSKSVAEATNRINNSIDRMVDEALKGTSDINKAFASIGSIKVGSNVVSTLDEIKSKLTNLDVQVNIKAFGTEKLLSDIAKAKVELGTLVSKEVKVDVDATNALQKLQVLEKELSDLQKLSLTPNISATQLDLFKKNIDSLRGKITELKANSNFVLRADNTQLINSFGEVQARLSRLSSTVKNTFTTGGFSRFQAELGKTTTAISNLEKRGQGISNFFNKIATSSNVAATSLSRLPGSANQATLAMTNLGRVVQDAPFGFIGIANNLNPLLESFQRLKATTGTTSGALKALGASLLGPAGIGFAISTISSLLIVFGDRLFGAGKKANETAREIKSSFDVIGDSTDSVQGDIAKVNALVKAATDSANSFKIQAAAIEELKKTNKAYFGDLVAGKSTFEQITQAADGYTQALIRQAIVKGLQEEIAELSKQIRAAKKDYDALVVPTQRAREAFDKTSKAFKAAGERTGDQSKVLRGLQADVNKTSIAYNGLNTRLGNARSVVDNLTGKFNELTGEIQKQVGISLKFKPLDEKDVKGITDKADDIIARARQFVKEFGESFVLPNLDDSFFVSEAELKNTSKKLLDNVKRFIEGDVNALKIKLPIVFEDSQVREDVTKSVKELNNVIQSLNGNKIEISIDQKGDVKKLISQLTQIKGVEVPIVVEQQGNIAKITDELTKLKGKTIPIKITEQGNLEEIVTQLKGIKDIDVKISAIQNVDEAILEIDKLVKGKEFPIIIDQDGIIFQITKAIDGAIKVSKIQDIKIPLVTDADIQFSESITKEVQASQLIIDNFFGSLEKEVRVPVSIIPDLSLTKDATKLIDEKLKLKQGFERLGDLGLSQFNKIDFSNLRKGLEEGTFLLSRMNEIANTLATSLGQGATNAFNSLFDAILEGKSVFKSLANAVKDLVIQTIKAIAQMFILRAVTGLIFPGIGKAAGGININPQGFGAFGQANLSNVGQQIGSRVNNSMQITGSTRVDGQDLVIVFNRAQGSNGR